MTDKLREAAQDAAELFDKDCRLYCSGDWQIEVVTRLRAALAAAPQPAPVDREALVEVIDNALRDWSNLPPLTCLRASYVADALLARGLRLAGDGALQQLADLGQQADRASETMAWALVGEDGKIDPRKLWINSRDAEEYCEPGERIVRVAIRVVEGGDDAA